MKKMIPVLCLSSIIYADSQDGITQIPEGKLIDYPSIYHDVTPGAGPRVLDGIGMFATADYIYWTARQDNMQYASTGNFSDPFVAVSAGSANNMQFYFQSGFKAGVGYSFNHDLWDTSLNYTWFQSDRNKGSITVEGPEAGLSPTGTIPFTRSLGNYFTSANGAWSFHFNTIDWELGRNFYISKYLSLRPSLGLKGSWQTQNLNQSYTGILATTPFTYNRNYHTYFWGVGIRSGCNAAWHLAGTWSIYADTFISALWGQFNTSREDLYQETALGSQTGGTHTVLPVLELSLGLRKEQWFCHDRFHFSAQVGWEEQLWWDQNQFALNASIPVHGNLFLQGLTVHLRFDF